MRQAVLSVADDETTQAFAVTRISGSESDGNYSPEAVSAASASLPMFGEKTLVEVYALNYNSMNTDAIDSLLDAVDEASAISNTLLILNARNDEFDVGILPKRPSALLKKFAEHVKIAYFAEETPSRIIAWMIKRFEKEGISADKELCGKIIACCGRSMLVLSNEIDKMCMFILGEGRNRLTSDDILKVCSVLVEPDNFGISDAILNCDREKLCETYYELKRRRERPEVLLSSISSVYSDLSVVQVMYNSGLTEKEIAVKTGIHEYRVGLYIKALSRISTAKINGALRICGEVDILIKSTDIDAYSAIERLLIV